MFNGILLARAWNWLAVVRGSLAGLVRPDLRLLLAACFSGRRHGCRLAAAG